MNEKHQAMLAEHKEIKAARREKHRNGWHKIKVIPILLR